jgi:hypothetical protein
MRENESFVAGVMMSSFYEFMRFSWFRYTQVFARCVHDAPAGGVKIRIFWLQASLLLAEVEPTTTTQEKFTQKKKLETFLDRKRT